MRVADDDTNLPLPSLGALVVGTVARVVKPQHHMFAAPALLSLLSLIGLLFTLLANGLWDGMPLLALGWVVAAAIWYGACAPPTSKRGSAAGGNTLTQTPPP